MPVDSGEIFIDGKNIKEIQKEIFSQISLLTADIKTPSFLTVEETMEFSLKSYDRYSVKKYQEILQLFDLEKHQKKQIKPLSSGLERRVELAQTLSNDSNILILDEPCNALDFNSVQDTMAAVQKKWKLGKTILYTTHQFHEIENLYTHIMVLKNRKVELLPKEEIGCSLAEYYKEVYEVIEQ